MSGDEQVTSDLSLGQVADKFDLKSKVDATFLAELVAMKQAVEKVCGGGEGGCLWLYLWLLRPVSLLPLPQIGDLRSVIHDGAPDVYIFTVSTLRVSCGLHCTPSHPHCRGTSHHRRWRRPMGLAPPRPRWLLRW